MKHISTIIVPTVYIWVITLGESCTCAQWMTMSEKQARKKRETLKTENPDEVYYLAKFMLHGEELCRVT